MPRIEFPFLRGLDEDTDGRVTPAGSLVRLENLRATRAGRLIRRRGFWNVPHRNRHTAAVITDVPVAEFAHGDQYCAVFNRSLGGNVRLAFSTGYSDGITQGYRPRILPAPRVRRHASPPGAVANQVSVASGAYYTLTAWQYVNASGGYSVAFRVTDASGNILASNDAFLSSTYELCPRALYANGQLILGTIEAGAGLRLRTITDGGTPSFGSPTLVNSSVTTNGIGQWDAYVFNNTTIYIAAVTGVGALWEHVVTANPIVVGVSTNTGIVVGSHGVTTYGNGVYQWTAYSKAADGFLYVRCAGSEALVNNSTGFTWMVTLGPGTATDTAHILYCMPGGSVPLTHRPVSAVPFPGTAESINQTSATIRVTPAAKPYVFEGVSHFWLRVENQQQPQDRSLILMTNTASASLTSFVQHWALPRVASAVSTTTFRWMPAQVVVQGSTYLMPSAEIDGGLVTSTTIASASPAVISYELSSKSAPVAQNQNTRLIGGANPLSWDGTDLVESWAGWGPSCGTSVAASGIGSLSGSFSWCAIMVWKDEAGNVYRSPPGPAVTQTLGSASQAIVTIDYLPYTRSGVSCAIELYRTAANGSIYYRVATLPVANTSNRTTYTDTTTDAVLTSRQLLWTTGGVLGGHPVPGLQHVTLHRGRLFGCVGSRVYYTHALVPGEGPVWPDAFYVPLDTEVTAIASLDDTLLVFTETACFAVYGEGPNRLGQNAFGTPVQIASDVGCVDWRSVVQYRDGVAFRSRRGIELMQRGGGVVSLLSQSQRSPDSSTNSVLFDHPHTFGVVCRPEHTQLRWLLGELPNYGQTILCLDYARGLWSTETTSLTATSCGLWPDNTFALGDTITPAIYAQTDSENGISSGVHSDGPSAVYPNAAIATGDLRPDGLMGWGRVRAVRLLGEYLTPQDLSIDVSYNGGRSWASGHTWVLDDTRIPEDPLSLRYAPARQKCESIAVRVTLTDQTAGLKLAGVALHGLSVEYDSSGQGSKHRAGDRG